MRASSNRTEEAYDKRGKRFRKIESGVECCNCLCVLQPVLLTVLLYCLYTTLYCCLYSVLSTDRGHHHASELRNLRGRTNEDTRHEARRRGGYAAPCSSCAAAATSGESDAFFGRDGLMIFVSATFQCPRLAMKSGRFCVSPAGGNI